MSLLLVDVWLLVFDQLDDVRFLWTTVRNTSRFLRDCVDQHMRRSLSQNWLVDLLYSDMHMQEGPLICDIHLPMVFARFSSDGTRMYFEQRAYQSKKFRQGSVRGWVPFIERYCEETGKPAPTVLHASKPADAPPLWEQMHAHWRNTLSDDMKKTYLSQIRHAISIGRGDHPPHYVKILDVVNDTELVDLAVDCKQREISFDWRKTFAAFFRELDWAHRAVRAPRKPRVWDAQLAACDGRPGALRRRRNSFYPLHFARRKRLQPWVVKNKHRMSPEMRWETERAVLRNFDWIAYRLWANKLCEITTEGEEEPEEVVPARLADDHRDLLDWPWGDDNRYFVSKSSSLGTGKCVVL